MDRLAAMCPKFKLIPNGPKPGESFCRSCGKIFDVPDASAGLGLLIGDGLPDQPTGGATGTTVT